jgi:hypothetical protein
LRESRHVKDEKQNGAEKKRASCHPVLLAGKEASRARTAEKKSAETAGAYTICDSRCQGKADMRMRAVESAIAKVADEVY